MPTRKLYYEDAHLKCFTAQVLSCTRTQNGWAVTLDATAFYPEGGGQAADTGTLGDVRVLDTREQGEDIVHLCDGPLTAGAQVEGCIDYGLRFARMQQHSGEHIVSGILHRRYGCHNTGFHMGGDGIVTVDFDVPFPEKDLPAIEAEANAAVWQDLPVRCWYPGAEELPTIAYRSKKALPWPVRIVEIPGFDLCACCGTHVRRTGEIGLIKLLGTVNFRGGTRMEMACGQAAFQLLSRAYAQNIQVSQAFSAKPMQTGEAARRMNTLLAQQKYRCGQLERRIFDSLAAAYAEQGNVVHFEEGLDGAGLRELADRIAASCGGMAAVFSGTDDAGYAFCLASRREDLRPVCQALTARFPGRGGGKPGFQQGRIAGTEEQIRAYFQS